MKTKFCPTCGRSLKLTKEERSLNQKQAIARAQAKGVHIGRPIKFDRKKLADAYRKMKSLNRVAKTFGCSRWVVRVAVNNDS